jgi:hypothetical protein
MQKVKEGKQASEGTNERTSKHAGGEDRKQGSERASKQAREVATNEASKQESKQVKTNK